MTTPKRTEDLWHQVTDKLVEVGERLSDVRNGLKELQSLSGVHRTYLIVDKIMKIKTPARKVVGLLSDLENHFRRLEVKEEERPMQVDRGPEQKP
jgi:hypothetical protein